MSVYWNTVPYNFYHQNGAYGHLKMLPRLHLYEAIYIPEIEEW
nr:hypothetical protein [Clostridium sp. AM45-5]